MKRRGGGASHRCSRGTGRVLVTGQPAFPGGRCCARTRWPRCLLCTNTSPRSGSCLAPGIAFRALMATEALTGKPANPGTTGGEAGV